MSASPCSLRPCLPTRTIQDIEEQEVTESKAKTCEPWRPSKPPLEDLPTDHIYILSPDKGTTPDPNYQHLFTLPEKDEQDGTLINTPRSVPAFLQRYSGNSQHSKTLNPFPISISFSLPRYGDSEALSGLGWISAW